jgi:upstream activation factor subunit UAF30
MARSTTRSLAGKAASAARKVVTRRPAAAAAGGTGATKAAPAAKTAPAAKKAPAANKAPAKKAAPAAKKAAAPAKKATAKKAPAKKRTPNAAFMKPLTPDPALAAVVGNAPLPRTEIVSKLWAYIKKNKLQDNENKRMVNADDKLRTLFGKGQVSMFEMAGLIGKHVK